MVELHTRKDGDDLKMFLEDFNLNMGLKLNEIMNILNGCKFNALLLKVSQQHHSNNDCLLMTVMSHGKEGGQIFAADSEYNVQELWDMFIGDNCDSLIGKPKLFFIQTCRVAMVDPGVLLKPKPLS